MLGQPRGLPDTTGYVKILLEVLCCTILVQLNLYDLNDQLRLTLRHRWHRNKTKLHYPIYVISELLNDPIGLTGR